MGHYDECRAADREHERHERKLRLQRALDDLVEGRRTLFVSQDDRSRHSRVSRAADLVDNAVDLLRLEVAELNDGFLRE